jgi:hypothetical protein
MTAKCPGYPTYDNCNECELYYEPCHPEFKTYIINLREEEPDLAELGMAYAEEKEGYDDR